MCNVRIIEMDTQDLLPESSPILCFWKHKFAKTANLWVKLHYCDYTHILAAIGSISLPLFLPNLVVPVNGYKWVGTISLPQVHSGTISLPKNEELFHAIHREKQASLCVMFG